MSDDIRTCIFCAPHPCARLAPKKEVEVKTKLPQIQCNLCGEMIDAGENWKHRYEDMEAEANVLATRCSQIDMALSTMDPAFVRDFHKALAEIRKTWVEVPKDETGLLIRILGVDLRQSETVAKPGVEDLPLAT